MTRRVQVDVAILGGGIVGLWTLARLRTLGYSCVLLESAALGAGQTLASQGIIHGGIKYALTGAASRASRAIAEMPGIWNACLRGEGVVDLSSARVLADHQHLWTAGGLGSRLMGLAASKVIRTGVRRMEREHRPPVFSGTPRGVDVYRVDEPVLDVRSVLQSLRDVAVPGGEAWTLRCAAHDERAGPVVQADGGRIDRLAGSYGGTNQRAGIDEVEIRAARYILAAGAGNAAILQRTGVSVDNPNRWNVRMQRRPLHMTLVREKDPNAAQRLPDLFGHCVGLSDKPRLTITTARDGAGRRVWYIGGQVSEDGVARERAEQIDAVRREVREALPWLAWDQGVQDSLEWAAFRIDRAEGLTEDGSRPDEPVVAPVENMLVVWPTKLAFAPAAADRIVTLLQHDGVRPGTVASAEAAAAALADLPRPALGAPPWDDHSGSVTWIT